MAEDEAPKPRGFQRMTTEQRRETARKGGLRSHLLGVAHRFTSEEAVLAGSKGGTKVSADRAHMRRIGSKGGSTPRVKG